jgi:hypothetical protein
LTLLAGVLGVAGAVVGSTPARAQGFAFGFSTPGLSVGVGSPVYGGYYGALPVAPYPYVVPAPVVVPRPVVVAPPIYGPRPYYRYGYGYGYRPYHHPYRY